MNHDGQRKLSIPIKANLTLFATPRIIKGGGSAHVPSVKLMVLM